MKMKKKSAAAPKSTVDLLVSPIPHATPHLSCDFPEFILNPFNNSSSRKKKTVIASSVLIQRSNRSPPQKILTTIPDLKNFLSSRTDSIKRHLDLSHSEILKEFEASQSRLSKRFKIHVQACQQATNEADQEYKKMSGRISESVEEMKTSYAEFITEAQASATRVCKTSIPELTHSMEKAIEGLRSRYGFPSTST